MEKRTPHYKLAEIQAQVAAQGVDCFTGTALLGIIAMGLSDEQALAVIAGLKRSAFFKSMTTNQDHRVWQDVYYAATPAGKAYVKLTLHAENQVVINFKAL